MRPDLSLVGSSFHNYINQVPEDDIMEAFNKQSAAFVRFLETIPTEKYDYRYAEGKWSIKEVLQHIIDAERVFAYRALRFDDDQLQSRGISSNNPNYVLALGFVIIGHAVHHQKITKERYL
jgi:hypothetical protein